MFYLLLLLVGQVHCKIDRLRGWNYINLHCRDNANSPVDWWILYKPPKGPGSWETGLNFSYITSGYSGKWQASDIRITGSSMLKHTLSPLFRPTYSDHLAKVMYNPRKGTVTHVGSSAMGVMMADELGGVWIIHTVPGLPDLSQDRMYFPESEINNGHLILCMSADFITLNDIAKSLREVEPKVLSAQIPNTVKEWLPNWLFMSEPIRVPASTKLSPINMDFMTKGKTIRAHLMVRRPGDKHCLYKTFAKDKQIVLDVYGHDKRTKTVCNPDYSVRNIDAISLKFPDNIYYVDNKTDHLGFAVSTAGPWQRSGYSGAQYWTCFGTLEGDEVSGKGGLALCLEDYNVWRSFDTLKIKEPEC